MAVLGLANTRNIPLGLALDAGLAQSFTDQFDFCIRTGHTSCATHTEECVELTRWLREAKQACQEIRESAGWLPDYQPG
jgi:hypothetical protein